MSLNEQPITVHIVYALPDEQHIKTITVSRNCSAIDAVKQCGLVTQFPELILASLKLGIFGKLISHDAKLEDGVRIEIYRPLIVDPKESRRTRALLAKK